MSIARMNLDAEEPIVKEDTAAAVVASAAGAVFALAEKAVMALTLVAGIDAAVLTAVVAAATEVLDKMQDMSVE